MIYKDEINLIYTGYGREENIFGKEFVNNNINNIVLEINGIENNLIDKYELKKGENIIKMIIKKKLINLEKMFYNCVSLKNINDFEYLDTRDINNFSYMFCGCSLKEIKPLENWNVSNGNDFSNMFSFCSNLRDIKPLENWNVSNGNNFSKNPK